MVYRGRLSMEGHGVRLGARVGEQQLRQVAAVWGVVLGGQTGGVGARMEWEMDRLSVTSRRQRREIWKGGNLLRESTAEATTLRKAGCICVVE